MINHIVLFSGGIGSWAAARRVAEQNGTENLILLFTDTRMEDADLYRFLMEAAANVGGELVTLADGRTPWQVFKDERYLGNSRVDPCSRILKRDLARKWINEFNPETTTIYVGIDWSEQHRWERMKDRWLPYTVEAPLCEPPLVSKEDLFNDLRAAGIKVPELYKLGFPHNNCGGFCIKAGIAHFTHLHKVMPENYHYHEVQEQYIRDYLDKDVSILKDRRGGVQKRYTLTDLRHDIETGNRPEGDWGGCGCFVG